MVLLTTTPRILTAISSLRRSQSHSLETLTPLPSEPGAPIDHTTILALSRLLPRTQTSNLNTLLRGAKVYVAPPPARPAPSPEYVALMERLRREQEKREYAGLVATSSKRRLGEQGLQGDNDDEGEKDDISPSLVFNILLSIVMCAVAMFYLTRWWPNDGLRVLVSMLTGIVVGVAEVIVYAGYLRKVRLSKEKERAKREKKVFIGEYRGEPADGPTLVSASTEKEEIWGRGVNGGMRRRVREKWEKAEKETES